MTTMIRQQQQQQAKKTMQRAFSYPFIIIIITFGLLVGYVTAFSPQATTVRVPFSSSSSCRLRRSISTVTTSSQLFSWRGGSSNNEAVIAREKPTNNKETTTMTTEEEEEASVVWNDWLFLKNRNNNAGQPMSNGVVENEMEASSSGLVQLIQSTTQPIQDILDSSTSGWALSYANLKPDTTQTPAGQAFLATNLAYLFAGVGLQFIGQVQLGTLTDICALASFYYHYEQLKDTSPESVRLALLFDYVAAAFALGTATFYLGTEILQAIFTSSSTSSILLDSGNEPILMAVVVSMAGIACLGMSWKYEYGRPYMFWHSLWHLASAYAGALIGMLHAH